MQSPFAGILLAELCTENPEENVCSLFYAWLESHLIWVLTQCCCVEHRSGTCKRVNMNFDMHHVNCWACWLQHRAATQPQPPRSYTVSSSRVWFWSFLQSWSLAWWDYDRRKDPNTWRELVSHPPADKIPYNITTSGTVWGVINNNELRAAALGGSCYDRWKA